MRFSPAEVIATNGHAWAVIRCSCNPADDEDALLAAAVALFREAYGEGRILDLAADPGVVATFDLEAITKAVRSSFPSTAAEGSKPSQLANYRSEPAEIVARGALKEVHDVHFPVSPQWSKANPNMPILGFDGWGLRLKEGEWRLVLIQVKATDDKNVPPREAGTLKMECERVPREPEKITRVLCMLTKSLSGSPYLAPVLSMLQELGNGAMPKIAIAPVIVRGLTEAVMEDLEPIQRVFRVSHSQSTCALGLVMSIGLDLAEFGRLVVERARAA